MCNYCGDVEETAIHVLRDCPLASYVWNQIIPVNNRGISSWEKLKLGSTLT
jgi:hypothetical protein